ncbi:TRAP transporter large permease subunit, partial [Brucella cytisi]
MFTFSAFVALMLIGLPISIVLCLTAAAYIWQTDNTVLFVSFPTQMFTGLDSYGLIAIPLFILIGEIMNGGGITRRIIEMA